MNKSDQYLAIVVAMLFLAGVFSFVKWVRERCQGTATMEWPASPAQKNAA